MKIIISGASGFIGGRLLQLLQQLGHDVAVLVRSSNKPKNHEALESYSWMDLASDSWSDKERERFLAADAVIHLAGESIAQRWTQEARIRIINSRVETTKQLAALLCRQESKVHTLLVASAIGYYGDRQDELLNEQSSPGAGFLAEVCRAWEEAVPASLYKKIRVAHLRIGLVLSAQGGALAKMLLPFKLGLGGRMGSGEQYMSWIALEDLLTAIAEILTNKVYSGPVNLVSQTPVQNQQFTALLSEILSRPAFFSIPRLAISALMGEMGQELLLMSNRVEPKKLLDHGFIFQYRQLSHFLKHEIGS